MNLCLAKMSMLTLLWIISPVKLHHRMVLMLGALVIVWALTSEFVVVFQCSIPDTWAILQNNCINHVSPAMLKPSAGLWLLTEYRMLFGFFFGISNILTEAALISLPLFIILKLQMERKRKLSILCCFGARVL